MSGKSKVQRYDLKYGEQGPFIGPVSYAGKCVSYDAYASLYADYQSLQVEREMLMGALSYAVDNPEFNSVTFDRMARAALAKANGGEL